MATKEEIVKAELNGEQDELWEEVIAMGHSIIHYRSMYKETKHDGFKEDTDNALSELKQKYTITKNR